MILEQKPPKENLLARETSPYLLQHKDNPVFWRPWGEEALQEAKTQDKPILLSIGYAACHWCHVMAHESFENPSIAALMNEHFVNIKVDREERPDLDHLYQQALAVLGEQGGWPLTMFLTPEGEAFWGGTYFPPERKWGRPGFSEILQALADLYQTKKETIAQNKDSIRAALEHLKQSRPGDVPDDAFLDSATDSFLGLMDVEQGGIRGAPKFPQPFILELLWRAWQRRREPHFKEIVLLSLSRMAMGGIYDHLGGGFHRYATDASWLVPHFEKMLYDNALMIDLMAMVFQETQDSLLAQRIRESVDWLFREMTGAKNEKKDCAFAASIDADSEKVEGRFYIWSETEIDQELGNESPFFKEHYDVSPAGNWEGVTILNRSPHLTLDDSATEDRLKKSRDKLWQKRERRQRPGWDDKVLADWNGLIITGLVHASLALDEEVWLLSARSAFDFICHSMTTEDRRLYHSWREGKKRHAGMLEDYANMTMAALALFEATQDSTYLSWAESWVEILEEDFLDATAGGYFMVGRETRDIPIRPKSIGDGATPNGNATMIAVLTCLALLTGAEKYATRAENLLKAFAGEVRRNLFPLATFLNSADFFAHGLTIAITGEAHDSKTQALLQKAKDYGGLNAVIHHITANEDFPASHPAFGKKQVNGKPTAYLCQSGRCGLPINEPETLESRLKSGNFFG